MSITRRRFLAQGAAVAAVALVPPPRAQAQPSIRDEDLVDSGDGFRRGEARDAAITPSPDGLDVQATRGLGVFTSRALASVTPFTHLGLHWSAAVPPGAGLDFELRTSTDGASWSPWAAITVTHEPDETSVGDYFAGLVYAGGARFVQYRATLRMSGGLSPRLRRVTATAISSPVATAVVGSVTVADDRGGTLEVTPREAWGADEGVRFDRKSNEVWPEMFVSARKLVIHHTATRNDYASGAEAAAEVRAIYRYHAVTQRWGDIGYTALVDKFGTIYEGRHGRGEGGGREHLSAGVVAGHDTSHNYGSAGVALLGDATKQGWSMPQASGAMWEALVRCTTFEAGRHGIRPLSADGGVAASDFLRSDDTWSAVMRNVSGHRETNATACPGDQVMGLLGNLRSATHARLTQVVAAGVTVIGTSPREVSLVDGLRLGFTWAPEVPSGWSVATYEASLEGWYKPPTSYDITYLSGYGPSAWPEQPRSLWSSRGPDVRSESFPIARAGHYTLRVRAILRDASGAQATAPYEGSFTYLVKAASTTGGKRR